MIIKNDKGDVAKMWGGYSPKIYNGHFIKVVAAEIDKTIEGTNIIADHHFNMRTRRCVR